MFRRILVAYDGSDGARAGLTLAVDLAARTGAELSSISVEEHLPRYAATISEVEGAKEQIDEHFRKLTKDARDAAALAGVELDALVRQGHEVAEILGAARDGKFDLLVLGVHGHSRIFERIAGSTSLSVARVAPCSVLLIRRARTAESTESLERIVVGLDGSPLGRLAFTTALEIGRLWGASLAGVTVREASPLARPHALAAPYADQLAVAAEEQARAAGVAFQHVSRIGHAAQSLRDQAHESRADLLVLGATGLEHPWSPSIGGTASTLAADAPCSVLLVRPQQAALHVHDIMVRAVTSVPADAPLAEVVERLLRGNVKALPVVDARRHLVGIITGGDLLRRGDVELRLSITRELDPETLRERLRALARSGKTARDVMSRHVHTIGPEADLATVIELMARHEIKRLPVVDENRELIGIVSRADVLRSIAALAGSTDTGEHELPRAARTVAEAATLDVPVVSPDTNADEVLAKLLQHRERRVVVVGADGGVLGVIGDRDFLAHSAPDTRPWLVRMLPGAAGSSARPQPSGRPLTAAVLMAPSLVTVQPTDSLVHAIRLMMQHRVKRLVVVDEQKRFRGLVDRREVLRLLAGEVRG